MNRPPPPEEDQPRRDPGASPRQKREMPNYNAAGPQANPPSARQWRTPGEEWAPPGQRFTPPEQRYPSPDQRYQQPDQRYQQPDQRYQQPDQRYQQPDQRFAPGEQRRPAPNQQWPSSEPQWARPNQSTRPPSRPPRSTSRRPLFFGLLVAGVLVLGTLAAVSYPFFSQLLGSHKASTTTPTVVPTATPKPFDPSVGAVLPSHRVIAFYGIRDAEPTGPAYVLDDDML